eukprot:snap_masked-scaffold217_size252476-processed-gene-1.14 protein:Tk00463 transcript:snap_masked-scaffold217_size252476-processed-gene-1.14-mRNA-1 annotation:"preli-like"
MEKYWSTEQEHAHPWSQVTSTFWRKYPNPHSAHVFSEDFVEVKILPNGHLYTRRFLTKTNKLPSWGQHFFSTRLVPVVEEVIVDPQARVMTTYTRNIGLRYFMGTTQREVIQPHRLDEGQTRVLKEAWIGSEMYGFRSAIKKFGIDRFKKNCVNATIGFDWVLKGYRAGESGSESKPTMKARSEDCNYTLKKFSPTTLNAS